MEFNDLIVRVRGAQGNACYVKDVMGELGDARNIHGDTLLHIFAAEGDLKAVDLLLQLGSDVNAQNNFGSTSIVCPAAQRDYNVLSLLMNKGADLFIKDCANMNIIDNLRILGEEQVIEWLLSRRV